MESTEHRLVYKGVDYRDPNRTQDRRSFKPFKVQKKWTVSKIWDVHQEVVRRLVLGQKNTEIAKALDISEVQVSNIRNSPVIQDKLAIMQASRDAATVDIARQIQEFAPIALKKLMDIIDGTEKNASIPLIAKTAESWLDRAGHGPVKKFEGAVAHFSREDIEEIKRRSRGTIIDAEFTTN
jgi:hypothetical protein